MQFDPTFRDDLLDDDLWRRAMIDLLLPAPGEYAGLRVDQEAVTAVPLYEEQLTFPQPTLWTRLYEGDRLWMSDTPQERLMMLRGTTGMQGHVLVAGGGLGLYPQLLRRYAPVQRVTVVERHPVVAGLLAETLAGDKAIQIIHASFAEYIAGQTPAAFDGCYIDIHPTLDPRWLPGLNWLRDRCAGIVKGTLRIWGYDWMARELVKGLEKEYISLLRQNLTFDDPFGRGLRQELPSGWRAWPEEELRAWLTEYAYRAAWPVEW